jgi:hypothetical protein
LTLLVRFTKNEKKFSCDARGERKKLSIPSYIVHIPPALKKKMAMTLTRLPMELVTLIFAQLDCMDHLRLSVCALLLKRVSTTKDAATCATLTFHTRHIPSNTHAEFAPYPPTAHNTTFRLPLRPRTLHVIKTFNAEVEVTLNFLAYLPSLTSLRIDSARYFCMSFLFDLPHLRHLDVTTNVGLRFDQYRKDTLDYSIGNDPDNDRDYIRDPFNAVVHRTLPFLKTLVCAGFRKHLFDATHLASLTELTCGFDGEEYHIEPDIFFRQLRALHFLHCHTLHYVLVAGVLENVPTLRRLHLCGNIDASSLINAFVQAHRNIGAGAGVSAGAGAGARFALTELIVKDVGTGSEPSHFFRRVAQLFPALTSLGVEAVNPPGKFWRDLDALGSLTRLQKLELQTYRNMRNADTFLLPSFPYIRKLTLPHGASIYHLLSSLHSEPPICVTPQIEHLHLPYFVSDSWKAFPIVDDGIVSPLSWSMLPNMGHLLVLELGNRPMSADDCAAFHIARRLRLPRLHTVHWCDRTYAAEHFAITDVTLIPDHPLESTTAVALPAHPPESMTAIVLPAHEMR